jgi:N-hydroxyarylamine O-acetyltransferase
VTIGGETWLTDAGVGGISLTSAIRLNSSDEQFTPHERRRIMREEGRFVHQVWLGRDWQDVCEFTGEEMPPIDRELANWWTSTNPDSKFRQNLMVARAGMDGTRFTLNNREFTHRRGAEIIEERMLATADELLELLAERFSLHFPAGTRFGPPGSPWPS